MTSRWYPIWIIILLWGLAGLLRSGVFQKDIVGFHAWRQAETINTIISFAEEDFNILNPRKNERGDTKGITRKEFPLYQWLAAIPVKSGADPVTSTRWFTNILFLLSGLLFYTLVINLTGQVFLSLSGAAMFLFNPLLFYYSLNPMPDTFGLLFGIAGLLFFIRFTKRGGYSDWLLSILLISLATLVKLPFILYLAAPGIWYLGKISSWKIREHFILIIPGLILMSPAVLWYLWVIPGWEGNGIVQGILAMDPDRWNAYWYYAWFAIRTTLPELLTGYPVLVLFVAGLVYLIIRKKNKSLLVNSLLAPVILLILLVLFELNMLEDVHDYYFLPFIPFIILIAVYGMKQLLYSPKKYIRIVLLIAFLAMPIYAGLRIMPRWQRIGFNQDIIKYKTELRHVVPDNSLVITGNDASHHIYLYYLDKKGWAFHNDWLTEDQLEDMIRSGASFLYSDSRKIDENQRLQKYFGTEVDSFGNIRVIPLKIPGNKETK